MGNMGNLKTMTPDPFFYNLWPVLPVGSLVSYVFYKAQISVLPCSMDLQESFDQGRKICRFILWFWKHVRLFEDKKWKFLLFSCMHIM